MRRYAFAALLLLLAAGCATPVAFIASPDDYAAYRKTRIARSLEDRLSAAQIYLTRYPRGAFAPRVRAWFDRAELVFFLSKRGSVAGLEAYLRALPEGSHKDEAEGRLSGLKAARSNREAELNAASTVALKLDRAAAERRAVRAEVNAWIDRFLDADLWRAPFSQARAEVLLPFSLELPSPSCAPADAAAGGELPLPKGAVRRCVKLLELPFSVTVGGASEARQATVEIAMIQDAAGRPLQASIGGPDLFLRLHETMTIRAAAPDDLQQRIEAIARASETLRGAFTRKISRDPACNLPINPPEFVDLGCHGVRLTGRAAVHPGEDDQLLFQPDLLP